MTPNLTPIEGVEDFDSAREKPTTSAVRPSAHPEKGSIRILCDESPCASRHAASAAQHVWKRVYGVSRFDSETPAWEKAWARTKLQSAILSLLPSPIAREHSSPRQSVPPIREAK